MKLDPNGICTVRLTKYGADVLEAYQDSLEHAEAFVCHASPQYFAPLPDGSYQFKLWELARIFGYDAGIGQPPLFEDGIEYAAP